MKHLTEHPYFSFILTLLCVVAFTGTTFSQPDPDPNSPTPVLITEPASTDILIDGGQDSMTRDTMTVFVANADLTGEDPRDSLRFFAVTKQGHKFRFPIIAVNEIKHSVPLYAITVHLKDQIGFWPLPTEATKFAATVTWRGLVSNSAQFTIGKMTGTRDDFFDRSAKPMPFTALGTETGVKEQGPEMPDAVGYFYEGDRRRFMQQGAFGPTDMLDMRIRRMGLRTYITEQLTAPYPSANNPYPEFPLKSSDSGNVTYGCGMFASGTEERNACQRNHYSMYPVQNWFLKEAFYGDAQLRHRVTWALSQIWVISGNGGDTQQSRHMIEYYKILANNSFGNYYDLMKQMTLNPGMGNYLSMARSTKNNPNENYAREILQLFTIGLYELNNNGTVKTNGQGQPIPTYDQDKVNAFTKVFTGFTFCEVTAECPNRALGATNYIDPLRLNQANHDVTAKTLLTYPNAPHSSIPSGLNGSDEMERALQNIFNHPNVGPFVSKLLIQHLVTSDPTPAYVNRVANAFNDNGAGVRGDMKTVIKAILLDPEARGDVKTDPGYGKLREPVQLMTNVLRNFGVRSADGAALSDGVLASQSSSMSQNMFNSPTVFNYYSPDFTTPGSGLLAPEFQILTTGTAVSRANFFNTMVFSRVNSNTTTIPLGTSLNFDEITALATADPTGNQLLDHLNNKMMHKTMSAGMRERILTAVLAINANNPAQRAKQALYLVATSSQFQIQR